MKYPIVIVAVLAVLSSSCGDAASTATTTTTSAATATTKETIPTTTTEGASMELTSPAFDHDEAIPVRYTCDGDDVSPELRITAIPEGTATLALITDDPDAPGGTWDHWIAFDFVPAGTIPENVGELGTGGLNSWEQIGYGGPCPPTGTHRYFFKVLALDAPLGLDEGSDKSQILAASEGHVLAEAMLMGTFSR